MHEEQEHAMMKPIALYTNLEKLVKREEAERGEVCISVECPWVLFSWQNVRPRAYRRGRTFCLHILSSATSVGDFAFRHPLLLLSHPLSPVLSPSSAVLRSSWASEAFE